jgi:hypothetical protein
MTSKAVCRLGARLNLVMLELGKGNDSAIRFFWSAGERLCSSWLWSSCSCPVRTVRMLTVAVP